MNPDYSFPPDAPDPPRTQHALVALTPAPQAPEPAPAGGGVPMIDFGAILHALRRRWWIPAATFGVVTAVSGLWLARAPVFYTATAEVAVEQEKSSVLPGATFRPEDLRSLEVLKSIEREIAGQSLLLSVANAHNLRNDPTFAKHPDGRTYNDDEIVALLAQRVSAVLERGTRHIVVKVDDTDAQRAKDLCDSILKEATAQTVASTSQTAHAARQSLEEEKARVANNMLASQKAVDTFRARYPSLPLDENPSDMKSNTIDDALRNLGNEASTAQAEVVRLKATVEQIDAAGDDLEQLVRLPVIAALEEVISIKKSLTEKQAAFAVLDEEYGPKHPRHQQAVKELSEVKEGLRKAVEQAAATSHNRLATAEEQARRLGTQMDQRKQEAVEFEKVAGEFQKLASDLKADRESYARILTSLKDAESNATMGGSELRVVDAPLKPTYPSKPRKKLLLAASGIFGLALGTGIVLLLHLMDRTLRSIQAGENLLRLPGLAALPEEAGLASRKAGLISLKPQGDRQVEAFRSLRTALSILGKGATAKSYLFTSARDGDGKSYAAMNFAVTLAQQGYRTLLIDANLRSPVLDLIFFGERNPAGLADHLQGTAPPDSKACQPTEVPGLYLFAAGIAQQHPSEVLHEQAFATILKDAFKWFHKIVIDTPAVGHYTDALPIARHVDSVCLVVRAASTPRGEVQRAANKLTVSGAPPVGFILNCAPAEALNEGFVGDFAANFTPAPMSRALPAPAPSRATAGVP